MVSIVVMKPRETGERMLLERITIKTIPIRWEPWTEEELEDFYQERLFENEKREQELDEEQETV